MPKSTIFMATCPVLVLAMVLTACSRQPPAPPVARAIPTESAPMPAEDQWEHAHSQAQFRALYDWMRSHDVEPAVAIFPPAPGTTETRGSILNDLDTAQMKAVLEFLGSHPVFADWKPLPAWEEGPCVLNIENGFVRLRRARTKSRE